MNSLQNKGSNQASNWATQRREAIEKAKKLKEERKFSITREEDLNAEYSNSKYKTQTPSTQTSFSKRDDYNSNELNYSKPPKPKMSGNINERIGSHEEAYQARNHLQLLKSKMKQTTSNGFVHTELHCIDRPGGDSGKHSFDSADYDTPVNKQNAVNSKRPETTNVSMNRKSVKPELKPQKSLQEDYIENKLSNAKGGTNRITSAKGRDYNPDDYSIEDGGYPSKFDKKLPMSGTKNSATKNSYSRQVDEDAGYNKPLPNSRTKLMSGRQKEEETLKQGYGYSKKTSGYGDSNEYDDTDYLAAPKGRSSSIQKTLPKNRVATADPYSNQYGLNKENERSLQKPRDNKVKEDVFSSNKKSGNNNALKSNSNYNQGYVSNFEDDRPIKSNKTQNFNANPQFDDDDDDGYVEECPEGCGRSFKPQALEKHVKVCVKVFQSKRKKFDSTQQRQTEDLMQVQSEVKRKPPTVNNKKLGMTKQEDRLPKYEDKPIKGGDKKARWKQQSEAFRAGMRAARGEKLTKEEQVAFSSAGQDDLIQCDHCGRKFNEKAATKHIPFCEKKSKMDQMKKGGKGRK